MKVEIPRFAALELTYRCNHQCFFCFCPWEADTSFADTEMDTIEWTKVVDTLYAQGVRMFSLTGGEALLRPDIYEIISYINSKNVTLNVISNGKTVSDDFLDFLVGKKVTLSISVPGLKTFQEITGDADLEKALRIFEKTKKRGIHSAANITVSKRNLFELYENIAYPLLYGADYILINRFLPGGRGLSYSKDLLTVDEVNQMLDIAEEVLSRAGRKGHVGTELPLCAIKHPERYHHLQIGTGCAAARDLMVIDPSGYVRVCNHSPIKLCRYDQLSSLKENDYWVAFRNQDYRPEMCISCRDWGKCAGGCREAAHVFSGTISSNDPLFFIQE